MNIRQQFQKHLAPTSQAPIGLHITHAAGNYLFDVEQKKYLDLIGGISVCNIGHKHPSVIAAIKKQVDAYLHIMVYGELIQTPQVEYATILCDNLPSNLNAVYFTNSGSEAVEGALKLAKRITKRSKIIACNQSYHGHTLGALSLMGDAYWRTPFEPLLPGVEHHDFNSEKLINAVDHDTACVVIELVQAERGIIEADQNWLLNLQEKCNQFGALLIVDEIQTGFGRTGKLWALDHYTIKPDILLLGKALGAGMPMGAFISSFENMYYFTENPVLGHLTTFGGHPVCCAAGKAGFEVLLNEKWIAEVSQKEKLFHQLLIHPRIIQIRSKGLLMAIELENEQIVQKLLKALLQKGYFSDWFLFAPNCIRIAPPLSIELAEIRLACNQIIEILDEF